MTIGYWREEAHAALRAARAGMDGPRTLTADVYPTIAARAAAYSHLTRMIELLIGGQPGTRFSHGAPLGTGEYRHDVTQLYAGLQTAVTHPTYPVVASHRGAEVAQSLRRAADALAVMSDILATHVVPDSQPRTPEGMAIRDGGGVQVALAGIAGLSVELLHVDEQLAGWLAKGAEPWTVVYGAVVAAAETVATDRFGGAAQRLLASAEGRPVLLDELDVARQPLDPAPAVSSAEDAATAVTAAQTGLWQQHQQFAVTHLHLATQLGLTVHALDDEPGSSTVRRWRSAAIAATALRGTPAVDVGRAAAGELREVLRWARSQLGTGQQRRPGEDRAQLDRVRDQLPALARALHSGLSSAVERGDVFVRESVLQLRSGSLIYHATERWRPALSSDEAVRDLRRTLWQLATTPANRQTATTTEAAHAAQLAQGYPSAAPPPTTPQPAQTTAAPATRGHRALDRAPQQSPKNSLTSDR